MAHTRRSEVATSAPSSGRLRFGDFEIDLRSGEVWKHSHRVRIQDQPFQVLRVLLEHPGEIVTRDELKQTLWPADTFVAFDDGLNTAVKKIRDVLGDSAEQPRYIETIPRKGYRFLAALAEVQPTSSPLADASSKTEVVQGISIDETAVSPVPKVSGKSPTGRMKVLIAAAASIALTASALVLYRAD